MNLYREEILDHAKNPRNFGRLKGPSKSAHAANPLCGDELDLDLVFRGEKVERIGFESRGCAISTAAASMLTEALKGKTKAQATQINEEEMLSWFGGSLTSSRRDCALLPLQALREVIER